MSLSVHLLLVCLMCLQFQAMEMRMREIASPALIRDLSEIEDPDISCTSRTCLKRSDDMGPFWANRGKKDYRYTQLYNMYKEPRSNHARNSFRPEYNELPLVLSSARRVSDIVAEQNFWKLFNDIMRVRERRFSPKRVDIDSPFFAARGKKFYKIQ